MYWRLKYSNYIFKNIFSCLAISCLMYLCCPSKIDSNVMISNIHIKLPSLPKYWSYIEYFMIKLCVASLEVDGTANRLKLDLLLMIPLWAELFSATSVIFLPLNPEIGRCWSLGLPLWLHCQLINEPQYTITALQWCKSHSWKCK